MSCTTDWNFSRYQQFLECFYLCSNLRNPENENVGSFLLLTRLNSMIRIIIVTTLLVVLYRQSSLFLTSFRNNPLIPTVQQLFTLRLLTATSTIVYMTLEVCFHLQHQYQYRSTFCKLVVQITVDLWDPYTSEGSKAVNYIKVWPNLLRLLLCSYFYQENRGKISSGFSLLFEGIWHKTRTNERSALIRLNARHDCDDILSAIRNQA